MSNSIEAEWWDEEYGIDYVLLYDARDKQFKLSINGQGHLPIADPTELLEDLDTKYDRVL